uniref:Uncharacterized protein n=1 Tax=Eutreptiella gymnastica TaxID=73025 RepID=A0A7S1IBN4_9EUGL
MFSSHFVAIQVCSNPLAWMFLNRLKGPTLHVVLPQEQKFRLKERQVARKDPNLTPEQPKKDRIVPKCPQRFLLQHDPSTHLVRAMKLPFWPACAGDGRREATVGGRW